MFLDFGYLLDSMLAPFSIILASLFRASFRIDFQAPNCSARCRVSNLALHKKSYAGWGRKANGLRTFTV